jgi:hypothetical protein
MEPAKINYKIYQGTTFTQTFRWETETINYVNIAGITKAAPAVITTATPHTLPVGWRFKVANVVGMKEINNTGDDFYICHGKTATTITCNTINSQAFNAYTSGGSISWNSPMPLTGYTGKMQVRETIDSTSVILELTTSNGGIIIDPVNYTISMLITSTQTAALNFSTAVYALELTAPGGDVNSFVRGNLTLVREVVR